MKAIIVGGGIAGLSAGIALQRLGIDFEIYESAPKLKPVGAGISLTPNAMQVLADFGLAEQIKLKGFQPDTFGSSDEHFNDVQTLKAEKLRTQYGHTITLIHRADLQSILLSKISESVFHVNKHAASFTETEQDITVQFEDGSSVTADLVLAADGIHSPMRKQMYPKLDYRYSGQTCWRGIANMKLPADNYKRMREAMGGKSRFGFSQVNDGQVYWFAVEQAPQSTLVPANELMNHFEQMYAKFDPLVMDIIIKTDPDQIIQNDLIDFKTPDIWHTDRLCLLGDAAHATTPNMGQGGAQAIEDAWHMARLWDHSHSIGENFSIFNRARLTKVKHIVNLSQQFGKVAHWQFGRKLLYTMMRLTPESVTDKQIAKIYKLV